MGNGMTNYEFRERFGIYLPYDLDIIYYYDFPWVIAKGTRYYYVIELNDKEEYCIISKHLKYFKAREKMRLIRKGI